MMPDALRRAEGSFALLFVHVLKQIAEVIEERIIPPLLLSGQLMELRGELEQLLSSSHRWVVVTAGIMTQRCGAASCSVPLARAVQRRTICRLLSGLVDGRLIESIFQLADAVFQLADVVEGAL